MRLPTLHAKATQAPLHVVWINDEAGPVGGCERYIEDTVRLLRERGVRNTLLYSVAGASDPSFLGVFDAAFPVLDLASQLEEIDADVAYVHRVERLGELADLRVLGMTPQPVLRFFHDHALFCLREHKYTLLGRKTCTRKIGLHCYTCGGFVRRDGGWPGVRISRLKRLRERQDANRELDGFVVGSSYMASQLAAHGMPGDQTHVLPLFVFPPQAREAVERESDLLFFAGQLVRGKGLDLLLRAMPLMKTVARLEVAGEGRQRGVYERLTLALGLSERVRFLGRLDRDSLARHYSRAGVVVMPSRAPETFGLVGPEAMSHATPVVATAVGGTGEWLEDGVTGIGVSPNVGPEELAAAVDKLVGEPRYARALGEHARDLCLERFSPPQHIERLIGLLESTTKRQVRK